ncbi:hypothetical protein NPIL_3291 [Nephila pilipes]|uniref:Uncharacterized protein n=1 Tax=Nephila pilipes TaxID=299642 RepID=A0A8X6PFS6_NEPPI|nr:hypothetical protein NPIL_3291 [Nephila pilipes]
MNRERVCALLPQARGSAGCARWLRGRAAKYAAGNVRFKRSGKFFRRLAVRQWRAWRRYGSLVPAAYAQRQCAFHACRAAHCYLFFLTLIIPISSLFL